MLQHGRNHKKHLERKSFFSRILAAFFSILLTTVVLFTLFTAIRGTSFLNSYLVENIRIFVEIIEHYAMDHLFVGDYGEVQNIFHEIPGGSSGITMCRIYDHRGILIAGGDSPFPASSTAPDPLGLAVLDSDGVYFNRNQREWYYGKKLLLEGKIQGAVVVGYSNRFITRQIGTIHRTILVTSLLIIGFGGIIFFLLIRQISRPLQKLSQAVRAIDENDFDITVDYRRNDELGDLARALETMSRKLEESFLALQSSEERFDLALRGSNDGIWDYLPKEDALFVSSRWKEILDLPQETSITALSDWMSLVAQSDRDRVKDIISDYAKKQDPPFEVEYRAQDLNGHMRWVRTKGRGVFDEEGKCTRIAGSLSDISQKKLSEERLIQAALYDPLTSLPNRALLLERLQRMVETKKRRPDQHFALLYLDYDGFKRVNDTYGHSIGDLLLNAIAYRLKKCLRSQDLVSRIGGDEFVILLEDCGIRPQIQEVAERIIAVSAREFRLKNHSLFLTVSIGIAQDDLPYDQLDELIQYSDVAMYHAKNNGKGTFRFYRQEMHRQLQSRWRLNNDLHKAIERRELYLVFQPIISLEENRIEEVETLLRWNHPSRGLISPAEFLPPAEESGFITQITDWILSELFRLLKSSKAGLGVEDLRIAFNISSKDFMCAPTILDRVKAVFADHPAALPRLDIEVTETSLIESFETVSRQLQDLRDLGIRIKLDDFGTGFSSLSYLHNFPLDSLKIDRSFVRTLPSNQGNIDIIKHIIYLAHDLGFTVVAEGVETSDQHTLLKVLGCDKGQGYLYARPLKLDALKERIHPLNFGLSSLPEGVKIPPGDLLKNPRTIPHILEIPLPRPPHYEKVWT